MDAYQSLLAGSEPVKATQAQHRSLGALIDRYYQTATWKRLKPSTRRVEYNIFERIREIAGDKPAATMPRPAITKIVDSMADRPAAANAFLRAFRKLMKLAIREEWRSDDPTAVIETVSYRKEGFVSWEEAHIEQFLARHPAGSKPRLALMLLLYTAQRRSDVVGMGWHHVTGDHIAVKQNKTGHFLSIRMHPTLAAELAHLDRSAPAFLLSEWGKPFVAASFGNWFRARCNEAGLANLSAHGLRKSASRRLAEAGCTPHEIAAITGHKTLKEVTRYTAAANQRALAEAGLAKQVAAESARTTVKPK